MSARLRSVTSLHRSSGHLVAERREALGRKNATTRLCPNSECGQQVPTRCKKCPRCSEPNASAQRQMLTSGSLPSLIQSPCVPHGLGVEKEPADRQELVRSGNRHQGLHRSRTQRRQVWTQMLMPLALTTAGTRAQANLRACHGLWRSSSSSGPVGRTLEGWSADLLRMSLLFPIQCFLKVATGRELNASES